MLSETAIEGTPPKTAGIGRSRSHVAAAIGAEAAWKAENTPSVMVREALMAEDLLTGDVAVPEEGSVLPDSYDFERGETRAAVLARMQAAMDRFLAAEWPKRDKGLPVSTVNEALSLTITGVTITGSRNRSQA